MISMEHARKAFVEFLKPYHCQDPKIALKIRHTYAVVKASEYLADSLRLDEEEKDLALLIGLLHDIGRFEQLTLFNSYDDNLMSHAECGLKVLFTDGRIRDFIDTDKYDDIIYHAIKNHSLFAIDPSLSGRALLHARIIRDADKLDNFRVKTEDPIQAMLDISAEELGTIDVSDPILAEFLAHHQIKKEDRRTKMDMWVSYIAFIFDFNFPASYQYVLEHRYIESNVDRIPYSNPETARKMALIRQEGLDFCREQISRLSSI